MSKPSGASYRELRPYYEVTYKAAVEQYFSWQKSNDHGWSSIPVAVWDALAPDKVVEVEGIWKRFATFADAAVAYLDAVVAVTQAPAAVTKKEV